MDAHHGMGAIGWHRKRSGLGVDLAIRLIVVVIKAGELRFKVTTHERNLYCGSIDGGLVLVCRRVDDFTIVLAGVNMVQSKKCLDSGRVLLQMRIQEVPGFREGVAVDAILWEGDAACSTRVESKQCSDSGRVLLRKFNRVVVGLHWCARLRHDCCYRSKDPVQRSWREQSIGRTARPIRNIG